MGSEMSFHAARVAPEKAVFRPALPMCLLPGMTEMQMAKSYFEKLKDPRWQKKRLEVLESNEWRCERCMDAESTLHVHHRQYFKGREPWDYEVGQLSALCEECHAATHEDEDKLLLACSYCVSDGPYSRDVAASLVAGFAQQEMNAQHVDDPHTYLVGALAAQLADWRRDSFSCDELVVLTDILRTDMGGFRTAVRDFIKSHASDEKPNA